MEIRDKVYGTKKITEPILLELISSPSVQRLKGVSQYGIPDRYYHRKNYSRYEHSVGVMLLLRRLGASVEEQVAGLLHDLSVLAFSHVTDWLFSDGKNGVESYHDKLHNEFVTNTEVPTILEKHGFVLERILDEDNFSLLENNIPNICADRVDYALRDFKYWPKPDALKISLAGLINYNGEMIFDNLKSASAFASNFLDLQTLHWGGFEAVLRYNIFSKALKTAMDKEIIKEKDFYTDDEFILNKLENSKNEDIKERLTVLKTKKLVYPKENRTENVYKKFRHVNPKVLVDNKLVRLSKLDKTFAKLLEKHRKMNKKGLLV
jgi:HD superfamily phosphohydrolase